MRVGFSDRLCWVELCLAAKARVQISWTIKRGPVTAKDDCGEAPVRFGVLGSRDAPSRRLLSGRFVQMLWSVGCARNAASVRIFASASANCSLGIASANR